MHFQKVENGLKVIADADDRAALRELRDGNPDAFQADAVMFDALDAAICNDEFSWGEAREIGALTAAPILVTRDEDGNVVDAYGFMDYQVISVQERLLETGEAFFQKG